MCINCGVLTHLGDSPVEHMTARAVNIGYDVQEKKNLRLSINLQVIHGSAAKAKGTGSNEIQIKSQLYRKDIWHITSKVS